MQISKSLSVVCAAAVAFTFSAGAADTPAQAKAREALDKAYSTTGAQPAPAVQPKAEKPAPAAPAPAVTQPKARKAKKAPEVKAVPAQAAPAATSVGAQDSASIEKARQALRAKMAEIEASAPQAPAATAEITAPAQQAAPAAPAQQATMAPQSAPVEGFSQIPATNEEPAKLEESRAALHRQIQAMEQQQQQPAPKEARKVVPAPLRGVGEYERLDGPPVPFSPEKQQKLADLLKKYRADEITPEQYHAERAKIISGK